MKTIRCLLPATVLSVGLIGLTACSTTPASSARSNRYESMRAGSVEKFGVEKSGVPTTTMPAETRDLVLKEEDRFRAEFAAVEKAHDARVAALRASAEHQSKAKLKLTVTGAAIAIASTALTVANPAANAVWIAGLGTAGGSLVTYQGARAAEGFVAQVDARRLDVMTKAYDARLEELSAADKKVSAAIAGNWGGDNYTKQLVAFNDGVSDRDFCLSRLKHAINADPIMFGNDEEIAASSKFVKQMVANAAAAGRVASVSRAVRMWSDKLKEQEAAATDLEKAKADRDAKKAALDQITDANSEDGQKAKTAYDAAVKVVEEKQQKFDAFKLVADELKKFVDELEKPTPAS